MEIVVCLFVASPDSVGEVMQDDLNGLVKSKFLKYHLED